MRDRFVPNVTETPGQCVATPVACPPPPSSPRVNAMVNNIRTLATSFVRDEEGATTAEYGIIIVVVAGIAIFVLSQLNNALDKLYDAFTTKVNSVN